MSEEILKRSKTDRIITGVAGGIGRYYNIDPVLVRLAFAIFFLIAGLGLFAYVILFFLIPEENGEKNKPQPLDQREYFAIGAIILGILLLLKNALQIDVWHYLWPLVLIGLGTFFIVKNK